MVVTSRTLRTKQVQQAYTDAVALGVLKQGCVLCKKDALKTFEHWKIVENDFPYDIIAETHHMIVPLRHMISAGLTGEEWGELQKIKKEYITSTYQFMVESTHANQSVPEHFHVHLIVVKENLDHV